MLIYFLFIFFMLTIVLRYPKLWIHFNIFLVTSLFFFFFKFLIISFFQYTNTYFFKNITDLFYDTNIPQINNSYTVKPVTYLPANNAILYSNLTQKFLTNFNLLDTTNTFDTNAFEWVAPTFQKQINESPEFFDAIFQSLDHWTRRFYNINHLVFDGLDNYLLHFSQFYPQIIYNTNRLWWRAFAQCFCNFNFFTKDYIFALIEAVFYNFIHIWSLIFYDTALYLSLFFYFFFIFYLFIAIFATVTQQYLGVKGLLRLLFYSISLQFIVILFAFVAITQYGITFFLEYKIYSIYVPTVLTSLNFTIDYLSASFMFLVTSIGLAAIVYSRIYLLGDPNTPDFLIKLNWFILSMLSLVISKNFIFFYFSWEFIGITSMWLINFNSQRTDTFKSAIKAFSFNKISDLCLFSALLIGYSVFKTSTITTWDVTTAHISCINSATIYAFYVFGVLVIIASSIKSAQLGFHLWLPDSMDAPVPASALIHSATLVSAGVYILLRFYDLIHFTGFSTTVALLGSCTAAYGGLVAGMQTDLKRALAYSTISHCGFLFTITVLGGSSVALLYLFLHGFYKALSFICAGDFIRLSAGYQDLNRMGGFFYLTPSLSSQFLISMGNLCGLPFFLGYYFKNNFQSIHLTNSNSNFFINALLICGLLSSLFYFFKVFYCVVFSFKKINYKNLNDYYRKAYFNFKYPLKSPKALLLIFWFIVITSLLCIFWYFNYTLSTLICNITDTQVAVVDYNNLLIGGTKTQSFVKINYFFFFYTLFGNTILAIIIYSSCRRVGWPSFLNNLTHLILFLFFSFICFL